MVSNRVRYVLRLVLIYAAFFVVWEIGVSMFRFGSGLLPSPSGTARSLVSNFVFRYNLLRSTAVTLEEVGIGFVIAVVLGVLLSIILASSDLIRSLAQPLIQAFQAIPKSALAPLMILWFGFGIISKVVLTFLLAFFPIVVNTLLGMTSVETELVDLLRVMRASKLQTFVKVRIPNALPYFFASLHIAVPFAVIGAVISEFIAADVGLGWVILNATYNLEVNLLFAALALLLVINFALDRIITYAEGRLMPWHITKRGGPTVIP